MSTVLQLTRHLERRPELAQLAGVRLRTFAGNDDIPRWLAIRHRAFARQKVGVRQWNENDFENEFLSRPWWNPQHLWFAESEPRRLRQIETIGTVALAMRGPADAARPVVHWLAVVPSWRQRGVGRLLMAALETRCWDLGFRQVWLETHVGWEAAVEMYRCLGYEEVSGGERTTEIR